MKALLRHLTVLVALLVSWASTALAQAPGDHVPDHYIVDLHPGADPVLVAARHGVGPTFFYSRVINGFAAKIPPGLVQRVQNDPQVRSVTPDRVIAAYDRVAGKPGGSVDATGPTGDVVPAGVKRIGADNLGTIDGSGVGVAIVDTGIDLTHPDLVGNIRPESYNAISVNLPGRDDHGHGTHVAGIVAATKGNGDVVGVASGAKLYSVKVLDAAGSGSDATVMDGLEWIAKNAKIVVPPIRVVNMSLGRPGSLNDNVPMRMAVQKLTDTMGISVVVAAGNNAKVEVKNQVPATYPEVMAIASSTALAGVSVKVWRPIPADTASYFTTDGAWVWNPGAGAYIGVTISAPGEDKENVGNGGFISSVGILSTALGGGTTRMSGTSMAAPHAAGVAALLWQQAGPQSTLLPEVVRSKIRAGADSRGIAPKNSPTSSYTYDNEREGVLSAPGALLAP